jgi:DNA-binding helix-hairpin-helix protein with protein kinase domain
MLPVGTSITCASGETVTIESAFTPGGQGCAYAVRRRRTGSLGVLKLFHDHFDRAETQRRLEFLIAQNLGKRCPVLVAPRDLVVGPSGVGYVSDLFPGKPLEEVLSNDGLTIFHTLTLAVALAHAMQILDGLGIAHGDIHGSNVLVANTGDTLRAGIIDFDNFAAPSLPPPPMVGQILYISPELRQALLSKRPAVPNLRSDRFAFGVLMHEVVLLLHPAGGADATPEMFEKAMMSGWVHDPARANRPKSAGGVPREAINADLQRLFRRSLSPEPSERPSASTWEETLLTALKTVHICDRCSMPFLVDPSKTSCPACGAVFPDWLLRLRDGRTIQIGEAAVPVGRALLGGSMKVSGTHAVFRKIGPDLLVDSCGRNGTWRGNGRGWVRLPERVPILLSVGDQLRLGDVEILVAISMNRRVVA